MNRQITLREVRSGWLPSGLDFKLYKDARRHSQDLIYATFELNAQRQIKLEVIEGAQSGSLIVTVRDRETRHEAAYRRPTTYDLAHRIMRRAQKDPAGAFLIGMDYLNEKMPGDISGQTIEDAKQEMIQILDAISKIARPT